MRRSTKAQMQIGEIVIVMVIFFFILILGLVFYLQFAHGEAVKEQEYVSDLNLVEAAKSISTLPELHCSTAGYESLYCIDYYKALAFKETLADTDFQYRYSEQFAGYSVELHCIYPSCSERGINSVALFDYSQASAKNTRPIYLPVSIYNPVTQQRSYGELVLVQHT